MVNLFYKSNQQRLRVFNEQRKLDLINQLKQKEKIRAINDQEIYNDEVADQLAKIYANFIEKPSIKKSLLTSSNIQMIEQSPKVPPTPASQIPMLEAQPEVPLLKYERPTKSLSAPNTPSLQPKGFDLGELQRRISVDPEEKKKIDTMNVAQLKEYLTNNNISFDNKAKKQDLRNLIYSTLPPKKIEPSAGIYRKRKKLKMLLKK
jgi:hypothetical protein